MQILPLISTWEVSDGKGLRTVCSQLYRGTRDLLQNVSHEAEHLIGLLPIDGLSCCGGAHSFPDSWDPIVPSVCALAQALLLLLATPTPEKPGEDDESGR
jgi:hypothetical protein